MIELALVAVFLMLLAAGGAFADSWERRDARRRNPERRVVR